MDPDANLAEQLQLSLLIQQRADAPAYGGPEDREKYRNAQTLDAPRLARLVLALNEWLARGGALPEAWKR